MVFVQNWPFFHLFFMSQSRPGKCVLWYSQARKRLSKLWKQKVEKVEKSRKNEIFRKVYGFCPRLSIFAIFFLWGNLGQENAFLSYEKKKLKKSKNWDFSKGVSPSFWSKIDNFSIFVLSENVGQENVFYDMLEWKNTFLGYKNKKWKSLKIEILPKGLVHSFCPKFGHFPSFFIRQSRPGKCVL